MHRRTKTWTCVLVIISQLLIVSMAFAEIPFVMESTADVHEEPAANSKTIGKMRAGQVYYTSEADRQGTWMRVYYEDMEFGQHIQGWIDENTLSLPSTPYTENVQANSQGYVLCQSLTIREAPDTAAAPRFSMEYGDNFDILAEVGDWFQVRYRGMERDVTGYVLSSYALKDPFYIGLSAETPAFAYPSPDAKRVALLEAGARYAVIAKVDGYLVISLRGASAFIKE